MIKVTAGQLQDIELHRQQGCLTRQDYLILISFIPLHLKGLSFIPGSGAEEAEVLRFEWIYSTLREWLDHLIDENKSDNPELLDVAKAKLQPRAIFSKAILDLATELLPRVRVIEEKTGQSLLPPKLKPFDVLLDWETQNFEELVLNSGLVGGSTNSYHESKSMLETNFRTIADALFNVNKVQIRAVVEALKERTDGKGLSSFQILVGLALIEAAYDDDFADSDAYVGFQKALKQLGSAVRHDEYWQLLSFKNGELLPHGRNAERKPKKTGAEQI